MLSDLRAVYAFGFAAALLGSAANISAQQPATGSIQLDQIPWTEAERVLTPDAVVVITIGAASKQHGPHLPLSADFIQAEYVKERVAQRTPVVLAPSLPYGYYPPFVEYPGSTTVRLSVVRDMVADICRSLARSSGARRFYAISHGQISVPVMEQIQETLNEEGLLFEFLNWEAAKRPVAAEVSSQQEGSHADEIETSMLLFIAPEVVRMDRAVREFGSADGAARKIGNHPQNRVTVSPSGVYGDPALATREKGRLLVEAVVAEAVSGIEALRGKPLPSAPPADAYFAGILGTYEDLSGGTLIVGREGALLSIQQPGQAPLRLQIAGLRRFGLWTSEARFKLHGDRVLLVLMHSGQERIARRIRPES